MEYIFLILIVGAIYYGLYKLAKSKNRNPWNWIVLSLLISPVVLIVVLLFFKNLPKIKKRKR
jgi:hypothetical protein